MQDYDKAKAENPEGLKNCVVERMKANFHVGVIAYLNGEPCAWISVGPLIDFYWTWKRVAALGEPAKSIAGIMCFTLAPKFRGQKLQTRILAELKKYGTQMGWTSIEAYPFSDETIKKHGAALKWPGLTGNYERAGFIRAQDHWLSSADYQRAILILPINEH